MKKFFIVSCMFLVGASFSLAQTTTPPKNTAPAKVTAPNALENIEIRVDRRLINFNRYIAAKDMVGIKSLVSSENKDFYMNFLKYLEDAPVFTVKRDTAQNIVKTPLDEYVFPAVMSRGGKDAKVSMKFIEEDTETGNKWVIVDSDLHIVWKALSSPPAPEKPVTPPTKWSLTSNALNKDAPVANPPVPKPEDPINTPTDPGEKGAVTPTTNAAPIASTAVPAKPAPVKAPALIRPAPKAGLWTGGIIGIAVWIALLLWAWGGVYYFMRKRKGLKKTLLAAQAVSVASVATAASDTLVSSPVISSEASPLTPPSTPEVSPEPQEAVPASPKTISVPTALEQMESNVSLVEDAPLSTDTPTDSISSAQTPTEETPPEQGTSSLETSPPQNDTQDSAPQNILPGQEPSSDITPPPALDTSEPVEENATNDTPKEDISVLSAPPLEEAPLTQTPVTTSLDDIIATAPVSDITVSLETSSEQTPVVDPIFSGADPVAPLSPDPLFEDILSPKPEPSTASSLFGI